MGSSASSLKRKRQPSDKGGSAAGAAASPNLVLARFADVPDELMAVLVELACLPTDPPLASSSTSSPAAKEASAQSTSSRGSAAQLDLATTLSLLTVSKHIYRFAAEMLYRCIDLRRPSALVALVRNLTARPQLCDLVKSLYIHGEPIPPNRWKSPLTYRADALGLMCGVSMPPHVSLSTSLSSPKEAALLPEGWEPGCKMPLDACWIIAEDPRKRAIASALYAVQRCLNIEFRGYFSKFSNPDYRHPAALWDSLLYEAQAAMDLYLMAMRRWELAGQSYAPLVVIGYYRSPKLEDVLAQYQEQPFILTRAELVHHLARPRSESDSFGHPLAFARSGLDIVHFHDDCRPQGDEAFWERVFSTSSIDTALPPTATLASTVALFRSLLQRLRKLETLSITGYLERAVCGPDSPVLPSLQALSIGSLPMHWNAPLRFDALPQLERLHLSYPSLRKEEVDNLVTKLPLLQSLKWDLVGSGCNSMMYALPRLAGRQEEEAKQQPEQGQQVATSSDSPTSASTPPTKSNDGGKGGSVDEQASEAKADVKAESLPLFEVTMRKDDAEYLLRYTCKTEEEKEAWRTGAALPGQQRRLKVVGR